MKGIPDTVFLQGLDLGVHSYDDLHYLPHYYHHFDTGTILYSTMGAMITTITYHHHPTVVQCYHSGTHHFSTMPLLTISTNADCLPFYLGAVLESYHYRLVTGRSFHYYHRYLHHFYRGWNVVPRATSGGCCSGIQWGVTAWG